MTGPAGLRGASLQLTAFEVQLILIAVFLAFVLLWVTVIEPYLAARTVPERAADHGGEAE